jgi:hypothetical protein
MAPIAGIGQMARRAGARPSRPPSWKHFGRAGQPAGPIGPARQPSRVLAVVRSRCEEASAPRCRCRHRRREASRLHPVSHPPDRALQGDLLSTAWLRASGLAAALGRPTQPALAAGGSGNRCASLRTQVPHPRASHWSLWPDGDARVNLDGAYGGKRRRTS